MKAISAHPKSGNLNIHTTSRKSESIFRCSQIFTTSRQLYKTGSSSLLNGNPSVHI
ncbi:MAG: hypothetical protein CSYNP_03358 [Syntrophus sp. SKADARSKE-3]|nr:hypothetical protein [Syntrophus sp. SKADARSKE-3]